MRLDHLLSKEHNTPPACGLVELLSGHGECPWGWLLSGLWNYWMSCCSVIGVDVSTALLVGVWNGLVRVLGVWCVGTLLGPETTPALVVLLGSGTRLKSNR